MQKRPHYTRLRRLCQVLFLLTTLVVLCASAPSTPNTDIRFYAKTFFLHKDRQLFRRHLSSLLLSKPPTKAVLADPSEAWVLDPQKASRPVKENKNSPQDLRLRARCKSLPLLLRFAWTSDIQLRQRHVSYRRIATIILGKLLPTFAHHFVAEEFNWATYLALVDATNQLHRSKPLRFMLHTGDAIDASTLLEFHRFLTISNKLQIPWLNAVGNHDTKLFGNYQLNTSSIKRMEFHGKPLSFSIFRHQKSPVYPIGSLPNFLWLHRPRLFGLSYRHKPTERGAAKGSRKSIPPSRCHGFDLTEPGKPPRPTCREAPGYYAFDLKDAPVRIIVLNSTQREKPTLPLSLQFGSTRRGKAFQAQMRWLKRILQRTTKRISLIFSHHRPRKHLGGFSHARNIIHQYARGPVVFFSGHRHKNQYAFYKHKRHAFYELNHGALLEYPQFMRVVELRGKSGTFGCLRTIPFWSNHQRQLAPKQRALFSKKALYRTISNPLSHQFHIDRINKHIERYCRHWVDRCDARKSNCDKHATWLPRLAPRLSKAQTKLISSLLRCCREHKTIKTNLAKAAQCGHLGTLFNHLITRKKFAGRLGFFEHDVPSAKKRANVIFSLPIPPLLQPASRPATPRP